MTEDGGIPGAPTGTINAGLELNNALPPTETGTPDTPVEKVDLAALPDTDQGADAAAKHFEESSEPLEQMLAAFAGDLASSSSEELSQAVSGPLVQEDSTGDINSPDNLNSGEPQKNGNEISGDATTNRISIHEQVTERTPPVDQDGAMQMPPLPEDTRETPLQKLDGDKDTNTKNEGDESSKIDDEEETPLQKLEGMKPDAQLKAEAEEMKNLKSKIDAGTADTKEVDRFLELRNNRPTTPEQRDRKMAQLKRQMEDPKIDDKKFKDAYAEYQKLAADKRANETPQQRVERELNQMRQDALAGKPINYEKLVQLNQEYIMEQITSGKAAERLGAFFNPVDAGKIVESAKLKRVQNLVAQLRGFAYQMNKQPEMQKKLEEHSKKMKDAVRDLEGKAKLKDLSTPEGMANHERLSMAYIQLGAVEGRLAATKREKNLTKARYNATREAIRSELGLNKLGDVLYAMVGLMGHEAGDLLLREGESQATSLGL